MVAAAATVVRAEPSALLATAATSLTSCFAFAAFASAFVSSSAAFGD